MYGGADDKGLGAGATPIRPSCAVTSSASVGSTPHSPYLGSQADNCIGGVAGTECCAEEDKLRQTQCHGAI